MTNSKNNDLHFENDSFYFESDHLALVGNKDYSEMIKTLVVLCAQRSKAIENYGKAVRLKEEALENPELILEKISKREPLGMPDMFSVPEIPVIDWDKYNVKLPEDIKNIYSDSNEKSSPIKHEQNPKLRSSNRWSTEEQKRLEELLQIYPPEPIEMKRFEKIAAALGNRTIQQVTSRVQKYFLKLYKAGLPIPGRIPKHAEKHKRSFLHKHQRHNHYLWKPTTFFPDLCVPVVMNEDENVPGPSRVNVNDEAIKASTSSNYLLQTGYEDTNNQLVKKSEAELQLELLKRIKQERLRIDNDNLYSHLGFSCDYCSDEPIMGIRWHCITCKTNSVDFCTDCLIAQLYSDNCHPLIHQFVCYYDKDSTSISDSESNPNSAMGGSNKCNETSESSDSDMDSEDEEENSNNPKLIKLDPEFINNLNGDKSTRNQIKEKIIDNFNVKQTEVGDYENETITTGNIQSEIDRPDFQIENDEDLFNGYDNVSYNYLHSNLFFD